MSTVYMTLLRESHRFGERHDCAVRAIAVVTGCSYETAWKLLKSQGRKRGRGTPTYMTQAVLGQLGFDVVNVTQQFRSRTIMKLEKELPDNRVYLIRTRGHILGYCDGLVQDWTRRRRHRVISIQQVVKVKGK